MEFGSDFHILDHKIGQSLLKDIPESNLYASGRQALLDLAITRKWKRLWVPSYFCEDTLNCISRVGIKLCKYSINPILNPSDVVGNIPVKEDDGLLIVNYFGLFDTRLFLNARCEIVEDHTHNLIGNWARNSNADWCIASLRKTLPIADGGILWSPKHLTLPDKPQSKHITKTIMNRRLEAMNLKQNYINGEDICKNEFLSIFNETEEKFDKLPISSISDASFKVVKSLDIKEWYDEKHKNWNFLREKLSEYNLVEILTPENEKDCPFSLILRFENSDMRNDVRKALIAKSVYPAILWRIEDGNDKSAQSFGDTMLSIHCDGRYSLQDMQNLFLLIKDSFK